MGLEGMTPEIILNALEKSGVVGEEKPEGKRKITKTDLFLRGLSGGSDSKERRKVFLKKVDLPENLSPNAMLDIINTIMDYEEFCAATGNNYSLLEKIYGMKKGVGQQVNRKLMRDIRIYMAVGGMPQAVESYVNGDNFSMIDQVKRQIIKLYEEDFKKIRCSRKEKNIQR